MIPERVGDHLFKAADTMEIVLQPALMVRVAAELGGRARASRLDTRHLLRDQQIEHLARALQSDLAANAPSDPFVCREHRRRACGEAARSRWPRRGSSEPVVARSAKRVLEHIETALHEPLSIDRLSRVAGASSSHLRTWFKAAMGVTLHRYVLRRRVERACILLRQGDLSTSEVAASTGFAHQSHLAHWMRREIGQTPRDLRRAQSPR